MNVRRRNFPEQIVRRLGEADRMLAHGRLDRSPMPKSATVSRVFGRGSLPFAFQNGDLGYMFTASSCMAPIWPTTGSGVDGDFGWSRGPRTG